jgi:hypothetical protein
MNSVPTIDPDCLLTRVAVADALKQAGYPIAAKTLATMATRGGGPPYRKWSKIALYTWGEALKWAQARLSGPRPNTSACDRQTPEKNMRGLYELSPVANRLTSSSSTKYAPPGA